MSSRAVSSLGSNISVESLSPTARGILCVLAVSVGLLAPALIYGIPSNQDLTNHFRFALPFHDALSSGDLYPGWLAESNSGYGDASFRFYPPGLYYLLSIVRTLTGDWYASALLTFVLLTAAGALGTYLWARSVASNNVAIFACFFYTLAPYHVNQLYQASLLAEYAASGILPFSFFFVERVCQRGNRRDIAGLGTTYALLLLTHLPLAVIGSIGLAVYVVARLERGQLAKTLSRYTIAVALGLAASAIYWITMLSELSWIGINSIHPDSSVEYHRNFLLSTLSPDNLNVWWMNILALSSMLLFVPGVVLLAHRSIALRRNLKPVILLLLVATFMTLPLSLPVWKFIPWLQQTQFPWRWLAVVSMAGSVLAAAGIPFWLSPQNTWQRSARLLILGSITISVVFVFAHPIGEAQYLNRVEFENQLNSICGSASVNYWFPIWASPTPAAMGSEVEVGGRTVTVEFWKPESRRFTISRGDASEARVRTFYYPHWEAKTADQVLATWPAEDGALMIGVPEESTTIDLEFREPQRTRNAGMLSVIGWLFIVGLASPVGWRLK